jgi:O-antigen/teichoic acid export membrane protein
MLNLKDIVARISGQLIGNERRLAVTKNVGWMLMDRVFRMGLGVLIVIWMARVLGPEQFGQYNFALSIIGILAAVTGLGLHNVVVRELVKHPKQANSIMSAGFLALLLAGLVGMVLTAGVASLWDTPNLPTYLIAILSLTLLMKSTDIVRSWFESQVQSRVTVLAENGVFLIMAGLRVYFIMSGMPLIAFVWLLVGEATLLALVFLIALWRFAPVRLSVWPKVDDMKPLVKEALPVLIAGLGVIIYMRIDQVMLGVMLGQESVGLYAAAVRISELWYFVPTAIAASMFPGLVALREAGSVGYMQNLRKLYRFMWVLSFSAIVFIFGVGEVLVHELYGEAYANAYPVLLVQIMGGIFVSLGLARAKWLMAESLQVYTMVFACVGAGLNVVLNFYFIPEFGILGAAYATVISYAGVVLVVPLALKATRQNVYTMLWPFDRIR